MKTTRLAYAAVHVCLRDEYRDAPHSLEHPAEPAEVAEAIDWDATMALRTRLDALGFGVGEAMDTAQRFSLGWESAERLIRSCGALRLGNGFCAGAGVDHLPRVGSKRDLIDGVVFQASVIRSAGGIAVLLPLSWLPRNGAAEDDYVEVYGEIVKQVEGWFFLKISYC